MCIIKSNNEPIAIEMAASATGEGAEEAEEVAYPSVCGELAAGKTYYLILGNYSTNNYSSNVTVNKHTHHFFKKYTYNGKEKKPSITIKDSKGNKLSTKNKKTKTVKGNNNTSKNVTGLKAKKKYYVRVRTYKTVNGKKYYSSWSKYKTVTTKK